MAVIDSIDYRRQVSPQILALAILLLHSFPMWLYFQISVR